jgi:hypothetical protein
MVEYRAIYSTSTMRKPTTDTKSKYADAYNLLEDMYNNFAFPLLKNTTMTWVRSQLTTAEALEAEGWALSG